MRSPVTPSDHSFGLRSFGLAIFGLLLTGVYALAAPAHAGGPSPTDLDSSHHALLDGRADLAAAGLEAVLAEDPGSGAAHLLLCRVWLSEGLAQQAATECQAALSHGLANSSEAQDWTGRALGAVAQHAGMIAGLKLALQVKSAFETAVDLDPSSEAATVDLGEYYTTAPAIVGGGNAKALALASRVEHNLPAVAHRIRAMAAERDKDFPTAEHEFQAEAAAGHTPGDMIDLAAFYLRRQDDARAIATARQTIAIDHRLDATVVEAAGVLDDAHQTAMAEQAMQSYLVHGEKSDTAPTFRVYTQLADMEAHAGDKTAARAHFQQALALASHYAPAEKGLGEL